MGAGAAAAAAAGGAALGGYASYRGAGSAKKAQDRYALELNSARNDIRDAYSDAQKGWKDYIPELQQGITGNIDFANSLSQTGSRYNDYLQGAAQNALGLGYKKATESIAPQLKGETANLLETFRNETLPSARSAAIDSGAYGGSRDYLTRERLMKNTENQIVNQAAADISNQRAQTAALLGADASSVNNYLNTGTAANNLLTSAAEAQHAADMAKSNYLWNLAMQYGNTMGTSNAGQYSSINPFTYGVQGAIQGAGLGLGLYNSLK